MFIAINTYQNKLVSYISGGQLKPPLTGRKKISHIAVKLLALQTVALLKSNKYYSIDIRVKGEIGKRKMFIKTLVENNIKILSIHDATPTQHGGCKIKKQRRK